MRTLKGAALEVFPSAATRNVADGKSRNPVFAGESRNGGRLVPSSLGIAPGLPVFGCFANGQHVCVIQSSATVGRTKVPFSQSVLTSLDLAIQCVVLGATEKQVKGVAAQRYVAFMQHVSRSDLYTQQTKHVTVDSIDAPIDASGPITGAIDGAATPQPARIGAMRPIDLAPELPYKHRGIVHA